MQNSILKNSIGSRLLRGSALLLFFFCFAFSARAETAGLMLITEPSTPEPNSTVTVSLSDYSINTVGSSISWYVDNVEQKENLNARSILVKTGNPGKKILVRVGLSRPNAPSLSASLTINPAKVDIILEASTYVPHFYSGRALPSRNSMMRVIAVVNTGGAISESSLVYKWTMDASVLFGGALKGKSMIDMKMPHYDDTVLGVEVFTSTGEKIGEGSILLKATEPELHFYEFSPLRGLSQREIVSPFHLLSEETTLYGEPFFLDSRIDAGDATFTWSLNNQTISNDQPILNALTLRHIGGGGNSSVGLRVVTNKTIPQFVTQLFEVIFE